MRRCAIALLLVTLCADDPAVGAPGDTIRAGVPVQVRLER